MNKRHCIQGTAAFVAMLIAVLSVPSGPCAAAEPVEFRSPKNGYSISLPGHWVRIPDSVLQTVQKAIFKPGASPALSYEAAFQEGGSFGWMKYPYVLVQVLPYSQFGASGEPEEKEFSKVVEAISGVKLDQVIRDVMSPAARGALKDTPNVTARLDAPNRRYFFSLSMNVVDVGTVRGEAVGYFGKEGVVQIMFYATPKDIARTANVRDRIFSSFKFDPAFAYDPAVAIAASTNAMTKRVLDRALLGGLIGGSVALLVWLLKSFRSNSSHY